MTSYETVAELEQRSTEIQETLRLLTRNVEELAISLDRLVHLLYPDSAKDANTL